MKHSNDAMLSLYNVLETDILSLEFRLSIFSVPVQLQDGNHPSRDKNGYKGRNRRQGKGQKYPGTNGLGNYSNHCFCF